MEPIGPSRPASPPPALALDRAPGAATAAFGDRLRGPLPGPATAPAGPLREPRAGPGPDLASAAREALAGVIRDGQRLDGYLRAAQGGAPLAVADVVAMQTLAYRYSQRVDLLTKLVERVTSGLKTTLQTQV